MNTGTPSLVANLYNPHEQSKDHLISSFVVRNDMFQSLFDDIKAAEMSPPVRHYLIQGQRGMGKTTLLLRLNYAIEQDRDLQSRLIPIVLKEEVYYGIRRLSKLWETIAREMEAKDDVFAGMCQHIRDTYSGLNLPTFSPAAYEQVCFDTLIYALTQRKQTLVLFIDNLGELLQSFPEEDLLRLREVLHTSPYIRLFGATSCAFEAFEGHNLARIFAETFEVIHLEGLNKDETRSLLLQLANMSHQEHAIRQVMRRRPGRIEALRILTGGVIRTLVLLFEIFAGSRNGDTVSDLNTILDRVTPLYQSRMQDLTPAQREIVNVIALNWDAVSPDDIVRGTFMSREDVSKVLTELKHNRVVQQTITEQQHFYRLNERFFNIWYLMRLAPGGDRNKVLWLLHFLESWYDKDELNTRARKHTQDIEARRYSPQFAYYLAEALATTGQLEMDIEHRMIRKTQELLKEFNAPLAEELSQSDREIAEQAEEVYQKGEFKTAAHLFLKVKHKHEHVYLRLGECFLHLNVTQKAVHCFTKAVEKGSVKALSQLARLSRDVLNDARQAETYYLRAVEKGDLHAMLSLGNLYYHTLHEFRKAEKYYLMTVKEGRRRSAMLTSDKRSSLNVLKKFLGAGKKTKEEEEEQHDVPGATRQYVGMVKEMSVEAMCALGNLYAHNLGNHQKAQQFYMAAIKAGHKGAIIQLAMLYQFTLRDYKKAIKYYTLALKQGHDIQAAVNLGALYQNDLKDYGQAEKYYTLAAEHEDAGGMNGLAWLYFEQKIKKQDALEYAWNAAEKESNIYTLHTLACIYLWNNKPQAAVKTAEHFMYDKSAYKHIKQDILLYLLLLLAKKEYQYLANYFDTPELNLREQFKPLYFAYLYTIRDENYYRRPPELVEPIKGMIGKITRLALDYA